jgi:hypothetical protein
MSSYTSSGETSFRDHASFQSSFGGATTWLASAFFRALEAPSRLKTLEKKGIVVDGGAYVVGAARGCASVARSRGGGGGYGMSSSVPSGSCT